MVSKSTVSQDVFSKIWNLINGSDDFSSTIISSAFPDRVLDDPFLKDNYPLIIISPCQVSFSNLTYGMGVAEAVITESIRIFTTSAEEADDYADKIMALFDDNQSTLESAGLYLNEVTNTRKDFTVSEDSDSRVHEKTIELRFVYPFTR